MTNKKSTAYSPGPLAVPFSQAYKLVTQCFRSNQVPFLSGPPGLGKSALFAKIAKAFNLLLIDVRLSQLDPTILMGFPSKKGEKGTFMPMDLFPIKGDKIPEGYSGWLLLLDELSSVHPDIQAAAYKILLDRCVGMEKLHDKCVVAAAGNRMEDNAVVYPMSTATQTRLVHLELRPDLKEFQAHASTINMDHRIGSFINAFPQFLMDFDPHHKDKTFSCPRTLEMLSSLVKSEPDIPKDWAPLLCGTVGMGVGQQFLAYCQNHTNRPSIDEVVQNPHSCRLPEEPAVQYSLCGMLGQYASDATIHAIVTFMERMSVEFQVITLRDIIRRHQKLDSHKAVQGWKLKYSKELF